MLRWEWDPYWDNTRAQAGGYAAAEIPLSSWVELVNLFRDDMLQRVFAAEYPAIRKVSIDYALMEHAKRVAMARAEFPWDDVGAWTALDRSYSKDERGNVTVGDPIVVDSENCIVYNDAGPDAMAVSVVGAEDLVVVVTTDSVLVIPKDRAQDVRHAVQELKKRNATQL